MSISVTTVMSFPSGTFPIKFPPMKLATIVFVVFAALCASETIFVTPNGSDFPQCGSTAQPCKTPGYTIGWRSKDGDVIVLADGKYTTDDKFPLQFRSKKITMKSQSGIADKVVLECAGGVGMVFYQDESELMQFTVSGCNGGDYGGAANIQSSSTKFTGMIFEKSQSKVLGGAVYVTGDSEPVFTGCIFRMSVSKFGGGVAISAGRATFSNCHITKNYLEGWCPECGLVGGGMYVSTGSSVKVTDSKFDENTAEFAGGIYVENAKLEATRIHVVNNHCQEKKCDGIISKGDLTILDSLFENNAGTEGKGTGITSFSTLIMKNTIVRNHKAIGAFIAGSTATIDGCEFSNNSDDEDIGSFGGGMYLATKSGSLTNSVFKKNFAFRGGGLFLSHGDQLRTDNVTFTENKGVTGGAIFMQNIQSINFHLSGLKIFKNEAQHGAGIYFRSSIEVRNSEIYDNKATENGGAIYVAPETFAEFDNVHVHSNSAKVGGGLWCSGGRLGFVNTRIESNTPENHVCSTCRGCPTSRSANSINWIK